MGWLLSSASACSVRGVVDGEFFQARSGRREHEFKAGSVFQLREVDVDQETYGLPEWMPAVQSALLNESATLFRRKYYNNSSHAGFILYLNDVQVAEGDVTALREALKSARGPGNFRNLFLHSPNGKKDGLQLIPVSEVAAKDEFTGITAEARQRATAELQRSDRGSAAMCITLALGRPDINPGQSTTVSGFKPEIDGSAWLAVKATHSITGTGGFSTSLELERENAPTSKPFVPD
jgi:hypothetical protein